jgi:uncharacterized SAM-binding protein YcdF (DUF218 family)
LAESSTKILLFGGFYRDKTAIMTFMVWQRWSKMLFMGRLQAELGGYGVFLKGSRIHLEAAGIEPGSTQSER